MSYDVIVDASGGLGAGDISSDGQASLSLSGIVSSAMPMPGDKPWNARLFQSMPPHPFETLVDPAIRVAVVPLSPDGESFFWFVSGMEHLLKTAKVENPLRAPVRTWVDAAVAGIESHLPLVDIIGASDNLAKRVSYDRATTTHAPSFSHRRTHTEDEPVTVKAVTLRIGDAANHLPNNLAQGASCAIEDGYAAGSMLAMAATAIVESRRHCRHSQGQGQEEGEGDGESVGDLLRRQVVCKAAVDRFSRLRDPRIRACRNVSRFSQLLSDFPRLAAGMQFVPAPINSFVFDLFLDYSLGGGGRDPASVFGSMSDAETDLVVERFTAIAVDAGKRDCA